MPCAGNPNENCGGPNRLNLYSLGATSVPTGTETSTATSTSITTAVLASVTQTGDAAWFFRGCYTNFDDTTLRYGGFVTDSMTVEKCQTLCRTHGYVLAGIEAADQCCKLLFHTYFHFEYD